MTNAEEPLLDSVIMPVDVKSDSEVDQSIKRNSNLATSAGHFNKTNSVIAQ